MIIAVFGLGEAGSEISAGLAGAGHRVWGYDPRNVPTPPGITRVSQPEEAVTHADFVFGITAATDATEALNQALASIPSEAVYADFSTASPGLKKSLAGNAAARDLAFVDVALMAPVPGKGINTPVGLSGNGAQALADLLRQVSTPLEIVSDVPGDAALRKLLRSVMMKGLAALLIEAMRAGNKAGVGDWLWRNMAEQLTVADESLLRRLVLGTKQHALRRLHEMEAAGELLKELDIDPVMTGSTVESLQRMLDEELPELPLPVSD